MTKYNVKTVVSRIDIDPEDDDDKELFVELYSVGGTAEGDTLLDALPFIGVIINDQYETVANLAATGLIEDGLPGAPAYVPDTPALPADAPTYTAADQD